MASPQLALLFMLGSLAASAQSASPNQPPPIQIRDLHLIQPTGPRESIHAADEPDPAGPSATPIQRAMHARDSIYNGMISVSLDIVINENGRVESAHATSGPQRFYAQAEEIERHRTFQPIRIDGSIVRARYRDDVSILPPEEWSAQHVPFPVTLDMHKVTIRLERTRCYGSCPSYTVALSGEGAITFSSDDRYNVVISGNHTAHISPEAFRNLLDRFRAADFLSAREDYQCAWTDMPTEVLTLSINGNEKKVVDYGGPLVGMPDAVEALEAAVDKAADTERWIKGNRETLPSLQAEHWKFSSSATDNLRLYDSAIQREIHDLTYALLTAKAPVFTADPQIQSPACVASNTGNVDLVKQMLAQQPDGQPLPAPLLAECLSGAARSGSLLMLDIWLDHGASPTRSEAPEGRYAGTPKYQTPLLAAIQSGSPEVVARLLSFHPDLGTPVNSRLSVIAEAVQLSGTTNSGARRQIVSLLIHAGADVNAAGPSGERPIFMVTWAPELVPLLVAAGADINSRGRNGSTPLMRNAFMEPVVRAMLAAGADPALKDDQGKTALDTAHNLNCPACVTLLEQAVAAREGKPAVP